ncbi:tRNA (adenosine(37)-N6)-dimethylallyltransferase MiaA [Faecalibaculum rodentium]|uniref:tRNA (adenosine(37)-N6)-dimethylallyltransferase MiaA n=1 Tax=Faecalibaculum rodentium TaxID=1702221 RepID=UPI00249113D2|nr:tRNA (adenosine(37)-N6)-dimethylallyltransferase MiaA [Faecalibaculum rodentium]
MAEQRMFPASPIAETRPKVLVIAGSTGTGKSRLAVELAKQFDGEVVSGDSMQVYRGMDIGTAKITPDEMQGIPHHLLDVRDPGQSYDVRQFQQLARASIRDILNRGHLPILCGGTGLYLKAALYDYEFEEQPEDPVLKAQLESMTNEELHTRLKREDPESAGKIHPNNRKRVIRALMIASSGKTKSGREKEQAHAPLFDVFWLGLEKQDNDARLLGRIRDMAAAGLEQEVRGLFADPASWSSTAFQGIGYKEWRPYFEGLCSRDEVLESIYIHTRQYARRQRTWFTHQMPMRWYDSLDTETIKQDIRSWLHDE